MSYPTDQHRSLAKAFRLAKNEKGILAFMRDLLTIGEIDAASERWQIATLLWTTNLSYKEIANRTHSSTTTITRVAQWIENGMGGYQTILTRLFGQRKH